MSAQLKMLLFSLGSFLASAQQINMNAAAAHMAPREISASTTAMVLSIASASASSIATINPSKVSSQLAQLLSEFPVSQEYTTVSETLGISVPSSLQVEIITAVPGSVLVELMDPTAKASMASEFQAGNTPAWYSSMPADVKSWFQQFANELSTGNPIYTVSATPTATATDDGVVQGTASSKAAAPKKTGADFGVIASAMAVAGVLGVGLAL